MLNLETFKVVVKSTKNGGLFIKVGDHKVPYDVASQMDYMGQAAKFVESTLGLTVIGSDYTTIVASKQAVKITEKFKFEQLSENAKEKAIENFITQSDFIDDFLLDSLTELCESFGFYDTNIEYSLDYSHIPYARLNGKFQKPSAFSLEDAIVDYDDDEIKNIFRSVLRNLPSNDTIYNTDDYYNDDYDVDDVSIAEFHKILRAVNDYLLQNIEVEYVYQQSEEFIISTIASNDYYFDVDGNFVK